MAGFKQEFKEFITRGNVMDMAVGIIIGSAFTAIVTSLVDDIIMPLVGIVLGGIDFSSLAITVGTGEHAASLTYGSFISAIINFLLIALVLFCIIRAINKMHELGKRGKEAQEDSARSCPFCKQKVAGDATRCPHCTSQIPLA